MSTVTSPGVPNNCRDAHRLPLFGFVRRSVHRGGHRGLDRLPHSEAFQKGGAREAVLEKRRIAETATTCGLWSSRRGYGGATVPP
eukprot:8576390-Pyramimonas_sp.AAC.1